MRDSNNKLIAEFMGMTYGDPNDNSVMIQMTPQGNEVVPIESMEYYTSWKWLMPVVDKIESLGYTFEKNFQPIDKDWQCLIVKGCDILYQEFNTDSLIACHYVVIEFIKWYNNKSK